jgi:phage tail tape-measure protein
MLSSSQEPGGPVGSKAKRGNPPSAGSSGSAAEFHPVEAETTPMSRNSQTIAPNPQAVGLALAVGAVFGAVIGAALGAALGDVGTWMAMGIPAGVSIGLAAGAWFSKPSRRSEGAASRWTAVDDGPLSAAPLTQGSTPDTSRLPAA